MKKLKKSFITGLLVVCLTGTTFANENVFALLNNVQNIVWLTFAGGSINGENPTNIIPPDECPPRDCGNCRPWNPLCRPRE